MGKRKRLYRLSDPRPLKKRKLNPSKTQETQPDSVNVIENTSLLPRQTNLRSRNWFLTWNNYPKDFHEILLNLRGLQKYVFQEEESKDGTPHIQGCFVFKSQKYWNQLNDKAQGFWRPARNIHACKNYCSKIKSRIGKTWNKGFSLSGEVTKPVDPLEGKELYPWQQDIIDIITGEIHDRHIYWFWSAKGNIGKTALCIHLIDNYNAILCDGKHREVFNLICGRKNKNINTPLVLFDIPRDKSKNGEPMISYTAIEGLKNGVFVNTKYEVEMVRISKPHILIFSNLHPKMSGLSTDRWVIKNLDKFTQKKDHDEDEDDDVEKEYKDMANMYSPPRED